MIICFQARAEDKLIRQRGAEEDSETKFHPPKREREKSVPKDNRGENLFSAPICRRKTRVCSSAISDKKKNFGRVRLKGILVPRRKKKEEEREWLFGGLETASRQKSILLQNFRPNRSNRFGFRVRLKLNRCPLFNYSKVEKIFFTNLP